MDGCCRNKFCFCGLRLSRIFCQINCHPLLFSFFVLRFCTRLSWFWTCFVHSSSSSSKEAPRLAFRLPGPPPLQVVAGRLLVGLLQESRNLSNFLSPWGGRIDWKTVGLRTYNGPILFWECELGGSLRLLIYYQKPACFLHIFVHFQHPKQSIGTFFPLYFQVAPQLEFVLFHFFSFISDLSKILTPFYWFFRNLEGPNTSCIKPSRFQKDSILWISHFKNKVKKRYHCFT